MPSDEDSHSIGTVMFGNDGSLFVGSGDGSNYTAVDPRALRSQNVNSLAGKIMRIDPLTGSGLPDNPFYDATCPTCNRSKVYAIGPAQSVPLHGPPGHERGLHRRRRLEHVGGDQHRQGRQLRLALLRGRRGGHARARARAAVTTSLQQGSYANDPSTSAAVQRALRAGPRGRARTDLLVRPRRHSTGPATNGGASANGGTFYRGTVYPPSTRTRSSSSTTTGGGSAT